MRLLLSRLKQWVKIKLDGFSLLEVCLVLIIFGIISSLSLSQMSAFSRRYKQNLTQERFLKILHALASFVATHKRLPCPCDPKDGQLGLEKSSCSRDSIGLVPYRTLGLPAGIARDGYGFLITYVVDDRLTDSLRLKSLNSLDTTKPSESIFCEAESYDPIIINDQYGKAVTNVEDHEKDYIAIVLVSHGQKGIGSYTPLGQRSSTTTPDKHMNADDSTLTFIDRPYHQDHFDDILMWVTRNHFMSLYVGIPCQPRSSQK